MKTKKHQKALFSFIGNQDPRTSRGDEGPILTLLRYRQDFDKIILFYTPDKTGDIIENLKNEIYLVSPESNIEIYSLPISDPTNHEEILGSLRGSMSEILKKLSDTECYISISSGTPAMHACWILLAAGGEIPAYILHKREERFVKKGQSVISEINPRSGSFPSVSPNIILGETPQIDSSVVRQAIKDIGIIGNHKLIKDAVESTITVANTDASVLIRGESGTGKELFAQLIHRISKRCDNPFIAFNCATLPESLVESELFGHEKGAFTNAMRTQIGKFELANLGTLFLDEIGDMSLNAQAKILRALNEKQISRVGGTQDIALDVRVIAATNKNLEEAIQKNAFREDLFYRLNVVPIYLPSLKEIRDDIPVLVLNLLREANKKYQKERALTQNALQKMKNHDWNGNIRELKNAVERLVITSREDTIDENNSVLLSICSGSNNEIFFSEIREGFSLGAHISLIRKHFIADALEKVKGNQAEAAKLLGISAQAISRYLKKHNIKSR